MDRYATTIATSRTPGNISGRIFNSLDLVKHIQITIRASAACALRRMYFDGHMVMARSRVVVEVGYGVSSVLCVIERSFREVPYHHGMLGLTSFKIVFVKTQRKWCGGGNSWHGDKRCRGKKKVLFLISHLVARVSAMPPCSLG